MACLQQDSITGDLVIANQTTPLITDRNASTAQVLFNRFRLFKGEWFLDQREGTPYFQYILIKNPNLKIVEQVLRQVILSVPSIIGIETFSISFDHVKRTLNFSFQAQTNTGAIISGGTNQPFIVQVTTTS